MIGTHRLSVTVTGLCGNSAASGVIMVYLQFRTLLQRTRTSLFVILALVLMATFSSQAHLGSRQVSAYSPLSSKHTGPKLSPEQAQAILNMLDENLRASKAKGLAWIKSNATASTTYAAITFSKPMSLDQALTFASKHRLSVYGWSYMLDIGPYTATGGHTVDMTSDPNYEIERARFFAALRSMLRHQSKKLSDIAASSEAPPEVRQSAKEKQAYIDAVLAELNESIPVIYGLKVSAPGLILRDLVVSGQVHAIKPSSVADPSLALYPELPPNWLRALEVSK